MRRRDLLLGAAGLGAGTWTWAQPALPRPAAAAGTDADIVHARFGALPDPAQVARVYAAGPPAGVLVAALAPDKLLGWPMTLGAEARALLGPRLARLPHTGRLAGRGSTVPLEALLQLQPDLVLDAGTADATHASTMRRTSEQTGLPTLLVQGRIQEHAAQLREVGRLLGVAARAEQLAAQADEHLRLAAQLRAAVPPPQRPRVYYGRGSDGLETGLAGSINVELLEFCGGRNVAAQAGSGSLTRVSLEQLLAWDPQVIVTQDAEFARRALNDPLWRGIAAVRARRVHCAPALPFGWLDGPPGVNRLIGVRWLVERLHPGHALLAGLQPLAPAVARFYEAFYGAALTDAQLRALLQG
ncbi:iron complex transport system substrate-binding protein [Oryzisolibacter propanilivorax]|uniref:Iron complex transport system substrate-binding protein n=1 Tax=Oryzisolibacter propanilivorax TaxID=1527607 RepID=A0A1G9P5X1_9BURK|nr:ABC transporter substrate-binding protein [Oryzisolibacter propanilivorax]SDL93627.1 iron complex transport system substrate-binding protein [Oryzisolibacter propanilivorax]